MGALLKVVGGGLLSLIGKGVSAAAIVTGIYYVILVALHLITDLLLALGGALIKSAISWNSDMINSAFVQGGYKIILGVANMGFIVALVVIAFATMFRSEAFGYKKALPKLIIAALLINFGYFMVTKWLIAPVDQVIVTLTNAANFGETTFSNIFDPRGAFSGINLEGGDLNTSSPDDPNTPGDENQARFLDSVPGFVQKVGGILAGSLASIAFAFMGIIALFAFAVMLFIRGIALSFLIILLPLAWVAWIFPKLKIPGGGNPWTMWWENFTRWLLFGPFAIFFLYLAIQLTKGPLPSAEGGLSTPATAVGGMIAVIGFMIGGLIVANKMGIAGAGYTLGIAAVGAAWAKTKGTIIAGRIGQGVLKGGVPYGKDEDDKTKKFSPFQWAADRTRLAGEGRGFFGRRLTAPARGIGRGIDRLTELTEAGPWRAAVKEVEAIPTPNLADEMAGYSPRKFAAAAARMQGLGLLWEPDRLTPYLARNWETVLAAMPTEATKERLNLEAKLGMPLKAFRHLKPLVDLEDTKEYQKAYAELLSSEFFLAKDDDGKYEDWTRLVRALSSGLKKDGKIKAEVNPEEIRAAIQADVEGWLPGKSGSAVAGAEPELDRANLEGGDYGRTWGGQNLVRRAQVPAVFETRPEQVNRRMAGGFPEGLRFWNQQRETHLQKLDQELLEIVQKIPGVTADAVKGVAEGLSKKDVKALTEAIQKIPLPKGTDAVAWREIIDKLPDRKVQERAIKLQRQGAEGLTALYTTLMQGRRSLFQWGYFTGQT